MACSVLKSLRRCVLVVWIHFDPHNDAFRIFDHELELSLSTRESPGFRDHAVRLGITTMSAGSRTDPGGYSTQGDSLEQFAINDERSPDEVARMLVATGYEPVRKDWDASYDCHAPAKTLRLAG